MDYLLNNPVSPLPALRQAAGRNPEPLILSGAQLTPSSSLAPGLTSRPSSSNSEQDELMIRAKALSLGENTNEAVFKSGNTSELHQLPNVLEAEKDDLNDPR